MTPSGIEPATYRFVALTTTPPRAPDDKIQEENIYFPVQQKLTLWYMTIHYASYIETKLNLYHQTQPFY
jgi:hypothetical protein